MKKTAMLILVMASASYCIAGEAPCEGGYEAPCISAYSVTIGDITTSFSTGPDGEQCSLGGDDSATCEYLDTMPCNFTETDTNNKTGVITTQPGYQPFVEMYCNG